MNDMLFVALPVILVVICVIYIIASSVIGRKRKKLRTVQAQVLSKRIKRTDMCRAAKVGVSGVDLFEYYVVFKFEKGKTKELQLPHEVYGSIEEGDKGQLSFKDYIFVSFDKNSCFFVQDSQ